MEMEMNKKSGFLTRPGGIVECLLLFILGIEVSCLLILNLSIDTREDSTPPIPRCARCGYPKEAR